MWIYPFFPHISRFFLVHFSINIGYEVTVAQLIQVKQASNETINDYVFSP